MNEFIDFVKSIYPCIDNVKAENAKKTLRQFAIENHKENGSSLFEGKKYNFLENNPTQEFKQGDIIDKLTFYYIDENGEECEYTSKAMLISNTCDAQRDRDKYLHFAPLMKIQDIIEDTDESGRTNVKKDILSNIVLRFLYIPNPKLKDYVVNFQMITSYPSNIIYNSIDYGEKKIIHSLNLTGYYLFLCKLTVYFIRSEKNEEVKRTDLAT